MKRLTNPSFDMHVSVGFLAIPAVPTIFVFQPQFCTLRQPILLNVREASPVVWAALEVLVRFTWCHVTQNHQAWAQV